jgi:hypothetical protein
MKRVDLLDVGIHLTLLHQLDRFGETGSHLGQFFLHLLDLSI